MVFSFSKNLHDFLEIPLCLIPSVLQAGMKTFTITHFDEVLDFVSFHTWTLGGKSFCINYITHIIKLPVVYRALNQNGIELVICFS